MLTLRFFRLRLPVGLLLWLTGSLAVAQSKPYVWETNTAGVYFYRTVTNDPMQARFYKLRNGLTVILSVNPKQPRISTLIPVRAGSNSDPRNHTGLAHYLEHMLFKGTDQFGTLNWKQEKPLLDRIDALYEQYNKTADTVLRKVLYRQIDQVSGEAARFAIANEYDKVMAGMGSQGSNAFTDFEQTVYTEDIPANAVNRFLAVQTERFRKPVLRLFHTELEAVYEEKNRSLDNDNDKVYDALYAALFPTHNYGQQTTIGTVEHLKNPSLVEIRRFYDTYYVPGNMAVIMTGDFNPDSVIRKIDATLGTLPAKPVTEYRAAPEAPLAAVQTLEVTGPTPELVRIGYRLPGATNPFDRVLALLCDEIMSNSAAGLIDLNLNKQQKILAGSSSPAFHRDYGVWSLTGRPRQGQSLEEVRDLLLGQVEKLKAGEFDEVVLHSIVANYKKNRIQQLDNNDRRAYALLDAWIETKGDQWPDYTRQLNDMANISKQQIMEFANVFFADNYVVIFKRKGRDDSIKKIVKPPITPVALNREVESPFLQRINAMPMPVVKPVFLDFAKDVQRGRAGAADLLYVPNPDNDLFKLSYRMPVGLFRNRLLPVAVQYLQFLRTDKYSAEDISKAFYDLACTYSIQPGDRYTTVQLTGLQENFALSVQLLDYLVRNCLPDDSALTALKGRLLKARADSKLNKGTILQGLISYAKYGPQNPFNNQLSDAELKALTPAQLIDVLHTLFDYPQQVLYYGPQPLAELGPQLTKYHLLPVKPRPLPAEKQFKQALQDKPDVLFADYDMVQAEVVWVRNTTEFNPSYVPTVELFNNYFGNSMASVVFQTLRESKALAYSTYASYDTPARRDEPFGITAYIGTQADKFGEAVTGMNDLLNNLPDAPNLLLTAKTGLKKTLQTNRIQQDGILTAYLDAQEKGIDYDLRQRTYDALDLMEFNDLKNFARQNIADKPFTYCVVASEKRVSQAELAKLGPVKRLTLAQIFGY
jgi:predicted Zn-dependent peptidase